MSSRTRTLQLFASFPALVLIAALAGCSAMPAGSTVAPSKGEAAKAQSNCAQSEWQAQTAPVINKRQGNEALEKYDSEGQEQSNSCR